MIPRIRELQRLKELLQQYPVVGILGVRQVGKTTLARSYAKGVEHVYFDLENPEDWSRLEEPMLALKELRGLVVIDEIQQFPNLFPVLRVLADRPEKPARFLILGSASPELLRQGSESLAGRVAYHEISGFCVEEVGIRNSDRLWVRGGFPRSYLAGSMEQSLRWRLQFIRTFLERDLPQLGMRVLPATMRRFWTMLAHYHGQIWNSSEFARSFGVSDTTVRHYLDFLSSALVVRQLKPWHENISKRQVKAPKIYLSDSGILHSLLNQKTLRDLEGHPKIGASWEGFVLDQVTRYLEVGREECFYWATHAGAELDLLIVNGRRRLGFEIKRTAMPRVTPSMRIALKDLRLTSLQVIHAGDNNFPLAKKIRAVAFRHFRDEIKPL